MLPWAHPSPQPKRYLDRSSRVCTVHVSVVEHVGACYRPSKLPLPWGSVVRTPSNSLRGSLGPSNSEFQTAFRFSRFCRAHGRKCLYLTKLPLPTEDLNPIVHDSLGPSKPTPQKASRSVQPFWRSSPQNVRILYNGPPLLPSKLPLSMEI